MKSFILFVLRLARFAALNILILLDIGERNHLLTVLLVKFNIDVLSRFNLGRVELFFSVVAGVLIDVNECDDLLVRLVVSVIFEFDIVTRFQMAFESITLAES